MTADGLAADRRFMAGVIDREGQGGHPQAMAGHLGPFTRDDAWVRLDRVRVLDLGPAGRAACRLCWSSLKAVPGKDQPSHDGRPSQRPSRVD